MPLVALVNGERTVSVLLADDDWDSMKATAKSGHTTIVLPGCGQPGYARISRKGLRHFAHKPGMDCAEHQAESSEHLAAKAVIVRAATDAGWAADPEHPGNDWIADVYATDGARQVAFEVQWSRQTLEQYGLRQTRYADAGVRGAWFARHAQSIPPEPDGNLPLFLLEKADAEFSVRLNESQEPRPLKEVVHRLLTGGIQFRHHVTDSAANRTVNIYTYGCWRCGQTSTIWRDMATRVDGRCGLGVARDPDDALWDEKRPESDNDVVDAARQIVHSRAMPTAARIGLRRSKTTDSVYDAFSCPHCQVIFGDFHLGRWLRERAWRDPDAQVSLHASNARARHRHWCLDIGNGHCTTA